MNCVQWDMLIESNQRPAMFDRERKQVKIGYLIVSVDACEIHRSIITK